MNFKKSLCVNFEIFDFFWQFWQLLTNLTILTTLKQSCRLLTIETLITILTIENPNSWQSLLPDNQEWHWTAFAILAMFLVSIHMLFYLTSFGRLNPTDPVQLLAKQLLRQQACLPDLLQRNAFDLIKHSSVAYIHIQVSIYFYICWNIYCMCWYICRPLSHDHR